MFMQEDNMNYIEARHLKHSGSLIDIKVSIKCVDGQAIICIRDYEFNDYKQALKYLRYITEIEIVHTEALQ